MLRRRSLKQCKVILLGQKKHLRAYGAARNYMFIFVVGTSPCWQIIRHWQHRFFHQCSYCRSLLIQHWAAWVSHYNFTMQYQKEDDNRVADAVLQLTLRSIKGEHEVVALDLSCLEIAKLKL